MALVQKKFVTHYVEQISNIFILNIAVSKLFAPEPQFGSVFFIVPIKMA